jgi:hypothetical protein
MNSRYENAKKYISVLISEGHPNESTIEEISWKFAIGDLILSIADQAGFDKTEPGSNIEIFDGKDIIIGKDLCILVRKANEENISEINNSESQPNPDNDISGPGL